MFVNTAYSCLATTSERYSFAPTASVTVQVQATGGACFSASLAEIRKQQADLFKAR